MLFGQGVCYTYDDVIMHPGHIDFGAHEARAAGLSRTPRLTGGYRADPLPRRWT